jgi:hypothetical protein
MTAQKRTDILLVYFEWLCQQISSVGSDDPSLSFIQVCGQMHSLEFNDRVPNDDNRAAEGVELRSEFLSSLTGITIYDYAELSHLGKCTILEMLIALTRRADFIVEMGQAAWFMKFLENLGLLRFSDDRFLERDTVRVLKALVKFNERRYSTSGDGGLFPLREPENDQRRVELWYQMAAYMKENRMY